MDIPLATRWRKSAVVDRLRQLHPQMVRDAVSREVSWTTGQLLVNFLVEVYREACKTRHVNTKEPLSAFVPELAALVELAQATNFVAHIAYNMLPQIHHPDIYAVHVHRFREQTYYNRLQALHSIIALQPHACVDILQEALEDTFEPIQRVALAQLARVKPDVVEQQAHEIVVNGNGILRRDAVGVFANLPPERGLVPVFVLAFDRNENVRRAARGALQNLVSGDLPRYQIYIHCLTDFHRIGEVLAQAIAQTVPVNLPRLRHVFASLRRHLRRSERRILAHEMHLILQAQRIRFLHLLSGR